jgi:mono/diheme cytochrome c family protein
MTRRICACLVCLLTIGGGAACRQDMHDTPRYEPLERSDFYADRRSSRPLIEGTVARGLLRADDTFYTGKAGATPVATLPMPVTRELLQRGRDRYEVYCAPCHSKTGMGDGMVVRRGYKQPPSMHDPRLRAQPVGYFYDVVTRGFGQMPDYAAQIAPQDRWAVAAYLRALQISQHATVADVPAADRPKLEASGQTPKPGQKEGSAAHE